MNNADFPYTSLHHYLDTVFEHQTPNDAEIISAKKAYRRLYDRYYKAKKRQLKKEFTLAFNSHDMLRIDNKRGDLSVSAFLYHSIRLILSEQHTTVASEDAIRELSQQIMLFIGIAEELLDTYEDHKIEQLLERLEQIDTTLTHYLTAL